VPAAFTRDDVGKHRDQLTAFFSISENFLQDGSECLSCCYGPSAFTKRKYLPHGTADCVKSEIFLWERYTPRPMGS
jgi:hypothetical protein